jgi:transcriptional regulator
LSKHRNDILQGTLALLVLQSLDRRGRLHGYALTQAIRSASDELLRVEEGSLYPALHRMEQQGWLKATWGITDKKRKARFYELTGAGRSQLEHERDAWERLTAGVQKVLRFA